MLMGGPSTSTAIHAPRRSRSRICGADIVAQQQESPPPRRQPEASASGPRATRRRLPLRRAAMDRREGGERRGRNLPRRGMRSAAWRGDERCRACAARHRRMRGEPGRRSEFVRCRRAASPPARRRGGPAPRCGPAGGDQLGDHRVVKRGDRIANPHAVQRGCRRACRTGRSVRACRWRGEVLPGVLRIEGTSLAAPRLGRPAAGKPSRATRSCIPPGRAWFGSVTGCSTCRRGVHLRRRRPRRDIEFHSAG